MSAKKTGGPAFPELYWSMPDSDGPIRTMAEGGMTIRDYFAAKAMQAFASGAQGMGGLDKSEVERQFLMVGEFSYMLADAMLKAREQ